MAVLLTGATGFVGRCIAQALLARADQVVAFAPDAPPVPIEGAVVVEGDVRSAADLDRAFAAGGIDRVIHAAALTPDAAMEAERPGRIVEVNVGGTVQVMQAARRAGVVRLVAMSSVAVYGPAQGAETLREDDSMPRPATLYGITKLAAEQTALRLGAVYGMEVAAVRLGPCFGINEHATGVRPMLSPHWQCAEAARNGTACVLPREMWADWIDATDAAAAIAGLLGVAKLPAAPVIWAADR